MQFFYHLQAGAKSFLVDGELYSYLFKVRRHRVGEMLFARNLRDGYLYGYQIAEISKKEATLVLVNSELLEVGPQKTLHLGWCVIDPKSIEKVLPTLNELGITKITFIYCQRSQKNFRIDLERLERILIASCQQCGRSSLMELEVAPSLEHFISKNKNLAVIDFSERKLKGDEGFEAVLVGCEGGFSEQERKLLEPFKILGLDTPMILRSESAVVAVAAKILV